MRRAAAHAIGSGVRPFAAGSGAGAAHLPHPDPHPGFAPNHVFHVARSTYPIANATAAPTTANCTGADITAHPTITRPNWNVTSAPRYASPVM